MICYVKCFYDLTPDFIKIRDCMIKKGIILFFSLLITFSVCSGLNIQHPSISTAMIIIFVPVGASYLIRKVIDGLEFLIKETSR